jgi:hypothetical protein
MSNDLENKYALNKKVKVFNSISDANLSTAIVTSTSQLLKIEGYDLKATYGTNSFKYKQAYTSTYYTISSDGSITIKSKVVNHSTGLVRITYYSEQEYNNITVVYSKSVYITVDIKTSFAVTASENLKDVGEVRSETFNSFSNISELITIGYTEAAVVVSFNARAESLLGGELQLRVMSITGSQLGSRIFGPKLAWQTNPFVYSFKCSIDGFNNSNGMFSVQWSKTGWAEYCIGSRTITITLR